MIPILVIAAAGNPLNQSQSEDSAATITTTSNPNQDLEEEIKALEAQLESEACEVAALKKNISEVIFSKMAD